MAPVPSVVGPRRLLRRIRDVMASETEGQIKLDRVVRVIAAEMVAEVCSIYVQRAGEVLELFATEGLNPKAVHHTRLRVGEGLVGEVAARAEPFALADAQSHPAFVYRPETGEDPYHSFLGVPMLRQGRLVGVVVVQNRTQRIYTEEEIEAMETVAMVLAELVAGGGLVSRDETALAEGNAVLPVRLVGVTINGGVALGTAVVHRADIVIRQLVAEDPEVELGRLEAAVAEVHRTLDHLFGAGALAEQGEHRDVLEAYRMVASDTGWLNRIRDAIRSGLTAEAGVQQVRENTRLHMSQISDPYLRERLADLDDLAVRVLLQLTGGASRALADLPPDTVVVCRDMGPAELLDYDPKRLRALAMEEGSATAHVSIVARALDIPVIVQVHDLLNRLQPGDKAIVDGDNGQIFVRPSEEAIQSFQETLRVRAARREVFAQLRDAPAVTRDGIEVSLNINAGLEIDMPHLHATGADGIGLFRTEIPFMVRAAYPDVAAQTALYRNILDQAEGRRVAFRTLDVGGDKTLPYLMAAPGENPALGWRAMRMMLDRPMMLRQQIRALVRAANGRALWVMFPMVSEVAEFARARAILDLELGREEAQGGKLPQDLHVGAMIEVPALLWQLPELFARADFVSIGSNDLIQFLFASDRGSPELADRYDALSPVVLRALRDLIAAAGKAQCPVSLCGEMAGRPLEAMALIALGLRSLSMTASAVGPVKAMVRATRLRPLADYLKTLLHSDEHSLRDRLRAFARDHNIPA